MKKKKRVRNSLIAVVVALVAVCVIVLSILLKKDVRGLNYFERNQVVAEAAGQQVTMGEYSMSLDNMLSYYAQIGYTIPAADLTEMQTTTVRQLLEQKVYVAKLPELGLSFTEEELAESKQTAQEQLDAIRRIAKEIGLDALPEPLKDAALLRITNPAASLADLAQLSFPKVTKSCLSHRLKKLMSMADALLE